METVSVSELVRCVASHLSRELRAGAQPEYSMRARLLLKRLKQALCWVRAHSKSLSKAGAFSEFLRVREEVFSKVLSSLSGIHFNQVFNLRVPKFALEEAGDVLCRGEYSGFPMVGEAIERPQVALRQLDRAITHKLLLTEMPDTVEVTVKGGKAEVVGEGYSLVLSLYEDCGLKWRLLECAVRTM